MYERLSFRNWLSLSVLILGWVGANGPLAAQDGRLEIEIVDEQGEITPCRAWLTSGHRRLYQPAAPADATPYRQDQSFSCDGIFAFDLPPGEVVVHIEKGKEYLPQDFTVHVAASQTVSEKVKLERWIDMPAQGWYSADLHVHLGYDNPRVLRQLALADDVHLIPSFTYWLRGKGEEWHATWPDPSFTQATMIDARHIVTRNNLEIERIHNRAGPGGSVGATFLFNLNAPVSAETYGEYFPTDATLCRQARQASPDSVYDSDKPSWAETVVGAALNQLDTIQVCHNHYHRTNTLDGGWGMIGAIAAGDSNAAAGDGLFHRTNSLYYRLLNCGFRLGVSGGSAIGVMPVPAGFHRVYARIDNELAPDSFWAAIRNGRTFATTGPLLALNARIGDQPAVDIGDELKLESKKALTIQVATTVKSIERLESLEIVHDGAVIVSQDVSQRIPNPSLQIDLSTSITPKRSGWVASRALYRAPDGRLRQAHTSPIYFSVDDKPIASAADARYMLVWIQRLTEVVKANPDRFPTEADKQAVLKDYNSAAAVYEQLIRDAKNDWGDL